MLVGEQLQHPVLGAVGVLVLVDQHPAEDPPVLVAHVGEQLEQVHGADQQIVEVHRARLDHPPLVERVDVGDRLLEARTDGLGVVGRVDELVLGTRDRRLDRPRRVALRVELELAHAALDHPQRVGLVVDREGALVAEPARVGTQDPGAGGVEGHHPHRPRDAADQARDPLAHLVRGLVGEGDREDLRGPGAVCPEQPGDPVGQHPGLPGSGAGEHQQRPLAVGDRRALGGVQPLEQALLRVDSDRRRRAVFRLAAHRGEDRRGPGEFSPGAQPPAELGPRLRRSCFTSPSVALPSSSASRSSIAAEPLGERLDRLGHRVGEVDPVGVRPLGAASLDPDRVARVADHGRVRGHVLDHHGVRADLGPVADRDRTEQLRPGADRDVVLDASGGACRGRSRCRPG